MPKQLSEVARQELIDWLQKNQINYEKIHRECSDGVVVANLLKTIYPKLVELHNYQPRSSFKLKLVNWETLNFKVLSKIGIPQKKAMLEEYSKGTVNVLELLFYDLMELEKLQKCKQRTEEQMIQHVYKEDDNIITKNVNKIIGDAIVCVPQKMIKYSLYQQALDEARVKDEKLQMIQIQVREMEEILEEKSKEIDSLCNQLAHQTVASLLEQCKSVDSDSQLNSSIRDEAKSE